MPHYLQDISAMDTSILTAGMKECKEGVGQRRPGELWAPFICDKPFLYSEVRLEY